MESGTLSQSLTAEPLLGHPSPEPSGSTPELVERHRMKLESQLYTSHTLSTWNSRVFEFAAVLFLADLFPNTLLPMSVYAFVRSASAIALAHPVGSWIDQSNRLSVVRTSIIGQRIPVAASCGILWLLELRLDHMTASYTAALLALLCILAGIEKVSAMANIIAVERDWVVVMTEGDNNWRRAVNARMRRIDLLCKLLGPLAASLIMTISTRAAIGAALGMNVFSAVFEYVCIGNVYNNIPALRDTQFESFDPAVSTSTSLASRLKELVLVIVPVSSFAEYFRHPAFLPSFSLSLLYLTVLSFSGQFITFLISVGYKPWHVGVARTGSTIIELSATWAAPRLMKYMGPIRGGIWSLSWQMISLTLGLGLFLRDGFGAEANHKMESIAGLIVCIALSRLGLWGYDLCAQTIIQEEVKDGNRGAFSSVEASFQNMFELLSFAITIVFSRPAEFKWPLVASIAAVYAAGAHYAFFVRRRRGHLFHPPACLKVEAQ